MSSDKFRIIEVKKHNKDELISKLREVTMLLDPKAYPYRDADIELRKVSFAEAIPAQRYVLGSELRKVQRLRWELESRGIDLYALNGYVTIRTDMSDDLIDVLPPIVEVSVEANGSPVSIINDGMHRMYVARLEWRLPEVVYIKNVPEEYPYYAFPIPDGDWREVKIIDGDVIPEGFIKKWHRISDNKLLYRNFNSSFENVGGPRGQGKK